MDQKISELIDQMTLEEKIGPLVQYSGSEQLTGPGVKDDDTQRKHDKIKKWNDR